VAAHGVKTPRNSAPLALVVLATVGLLTGCSPTTGHPAGPPTAAVTSKTVAPEHNPVGDIPDTQVYVPYRPTSQVFPVSVPAGWAQIDDGSATTFTDKLNAVRIEIKPFLDTLTPDVVQQEKLPPIHAASPGYHFGAISVVQRKSGPVILDTYQIASPPNEVTGKRGVDAVERYSFWRDGHEVVLTAPYSGRE